MNVLLLLMAMMVQSSPEFPHPEFVMKCYPEAAMPGDTLYIRIVAINSHAKSIYISDDFWPTDIDIQIHLRDLENQQRSLLFESPTNEEYVCPLHLVKIMSGDSHIIAALAINIPPLEDWKTTFWEKHLENLSASDVKFSLCATILSCAATNNNRIEERLPFSVEIPVIMKPRPEKEITLIQKWYAATPKDWFPVLESDRNPVRKIPGHRRLTFQWVDNIFVKGEKVSHWYFIPIGNRYPGHPNAPETWQGWKELEESLTPSTMRDEIRLTRILIQYCDTEDDTVLKELKEWFADMNETQQTVMAKLLRDRAFDSRGTKFLTQFREIYKTIRQYDVVPVPESNVKHLRNLGLIE